MSIMEPTMYEQDWGTALQATGHHKP
jgi:hypothetical protein